MQLNSFTECVSSCSLDLALDLALDALFDFVFVCFDSFVCSLFGADVFKLLLSVVF